MLLSSGAATSAPPSASDSERLRASSAPPLPSRHDPWPFLRCVWICVIALAIMRTRTPRAIGRALQGTVAPAPFNISTSPAPFRRRGIGPGPGRRRLSPSVRDGPESPRIMARRRGRRARLQPTLHRSLPFPSTPTKEPEERVGSSRRVVNASQGPPRRRTPPPPTPARRRTRTPPHAPSSTARVRLTTLTPKPCNLTPRHASYKLRLNAPHANA